MMKKLLSLLLALTMLLSLAGCAAQASPSEAPKTRTFTDSCGRTVEVPAQITKVAVSGTMAQMLVFALAPDTLAGVAGKWDASAKEYLDAKYYALPVLGHLYGGKGELNLETLLSSGAQVVIDVGEAKDGIADDLDRLSAQTGIPFVHIAMTTDTMGGAFRTLGELLGMEDAAEDLAVYCERVYARAKEIAANVEKVRLLYCLGVNGLSVIAKDSYQSELIDLLADNCAVVDAASAKGTGNESDMEQLLLWDPDVILFAPDSIYDTVADDPVWRQLTAIREERYYEVPFGPYNFMGFPPSVQRLAGMLWLPKLLYGDAADYDLQSELTEFYERFYHCSLTDGQYRVLMENSIER